MASIFGHALAAIALGTSFKKNTQGQPPEQTDEVIKESDLKTIKVKSKTFKSRLVSKKFWILGAICAMLPDADVIGFQFGIKYQSLWGHRGFSHSIVFALLLGIAVTLFFYRKSFGTREGWLYIFFFTLCTISHGVLDALTNGGLGVAFFAPFDTTRYFFPWRPIQVSPIGASKFFSHWGLKVIFSELIWIGIPAGLYILSTFTLKKIFSEKQE